METRMERTQKGIGIALVYALWQMKKMPKALVDVYQRWQRLMTFNRSIIMV